MGVPEAGQVQGNWSILSGGNGRREIIPNIINSSQASSEGSTSNTVVDTFANGSDGRSTTADDTNAEVFQVPGFNGLMSRRFFDVSTGLIGMEDGDSWEPWIAGDVCPVENEQHFMGDDLSTLVDWLEPDYWNIP
jgi:hypothetical protein